MSIAAPTPFPSSSAVIAEDPAATPVEPSDPAEPAVSPAVSGADRARNLAASLCRHVSRPMGAAILFAAITWATVHYLGARVPPRTLKLYAAGVFAAVVYGLAALRDRDLLVGAKMLRALTASQQPILKKLLAAWPVTFPAIALAAALPKRLDPRTMVLAADVAMLGMGYADEQGLASKFM